MLKKILKWIGIIAGSIVVLILIFYAIVYFKTEQRANKQYSFNLQPLTIPVDSAAYNLGNHVAGVRGCKTCHAGGGTPFLDEKNPLGILYAANITSGEGGIHYTDQDWIRTLRHGVGKDGKSVWFMPSQHTSAALSNQELAALICYLKKMPPVNKTNPKKQFKPLGRLLTFFGAFPMFTAEQVDHNAVYPEIVKPEASVSYGKYLAITCQGCHGANYKGGPAHNPGEPAIADISSTGNISRWTAAQFSTTLHSGTTPEGKKLSSAMPWVMIGNAYTETELEAVYLNLRQSK